MEDINATKLVRLTPAAHGQVQAVVESMQKKLGRRVSNSEAVFAACWAWHDRGAQEVFETVIVPEASVAQGGPERDQDG